MTGNLKNYDKLMTSFSLIIRIILVGSMVIVGMQRLELVFSLPRSAWECIQLFTTYARASLVAPRFLCATEKRPMIPDNSNHIAAGIGTAETVTLVLTAVKSMGVRP